MQMTWAYIAGFFDGEGCIHAIGPGKNLGKFRVTIAQTKDVGRAVLEEIAAFLNAQGIYGYVCAHHNRKEQREHPGKRSPCWNLWVTQQRSVRLFLDGVLPYLRVKKQRAEDYRRYAIIFQHETGLHNTSQIKLRRDVFTRLMDSGKTVAEIAKIHGLDYSTVWMKAKRLGYHVDSTVESNVKRAKFPLDMLVASFQELGDVRAVAKKYDLPYSNLVTRFKRYGVIPAHDVSSLIPK